LERALIAPERKRIAHLLRRTGFGASPAELDRYEEMGFDAAIDALLDYPPWPDPYPVDPAIEAAFQDDPREGQQLAREALRELPGWWIARMLTTPNPLEEKMTLFWHGHFTSAARKVQDGRLMIAQNRMLRRNALGSFERLALDASRDAAMLIYLDGTRSNAAAPNENYARELMELFTMGIGNYSEDDVKESARALTGWKVQRESGTVRYVPRLHDDSEKTYLGQTGAFQLEDIVRIAVAHPATGRRLAAKLVKFFLRPDPPDDLVARLAAVYYAGGYSIRAMLEHLLRSDEFSSATAYRANIKSPVELLVGGLRTLGVTQAGPQVGRLLVPLGQALFSPPSVKGWDGGRAWIGASSLLTRFNVAALATSGARDPAPAEPASGPEAAAGAVIDRLLDGQVSTGVRAALVDYATAMRDHPQPRSRGLLRLAMTAPEYQLN
jgi:uncharacterized protein (DUF1800 family)